MDGMHRGSEQPQPSDRPRPVPKLEKGIEKNFISPIVITDKRDKTIKPSMDSKIKNKAIHKNKVQMQNINCLINNIAQSISESLQENKILEFFQPSTYVTRIVNYRSMNQPQSNAFSRI